MNTVMRPMGWGHDATLTTATDLRSFVANALTHCWLGSDENDPNEDCNFGRPVTTDDVTELRSFLLDTLETTIFGLWKGHFTPGEGDIDGDYQALFIRKDDEKDSHDDTMLQWFVRLDNDAIMIALTCTGADDTALWLSYDALNDRQYVVKVLAEARQYTFHKEVWDKLTQEANNAPAAG